MRIEKVGRTVLGVVCCLLGMGSCAADEGEPWREPIGGVEQALLPQDVIPYTPIPAPLDGSNDGVWGNRAPTQSCQNILFGTASNPNDFLCRWVVVWDRDNLYFYADTSDDVAQRSVSPIPWQNDSLELYIDADASRGRYYDGRNDFELVLGVEPTRIGFGLNSVRRSAGIRYVPVDFAPGLAGLTIRMAIPWSTLGVVPAPGKRIGLEVHYNDNDNGLYRDAKRATFGTTDNAWYTPAAFGTFVLGELTDAG